MDINEIPRGQLSTIILTCLLDGDKYGYEIIQSVEEKTNGNVVIKKPSLYSSLTRMENQELVSSYWKESDIGGRRHYYRLTDYGRKQVLQWQDDLVKSQNSVSKMIEPEQKKPTILQQENLFSAMKTEQEEKKEQTQNKNENYIQYDLFSSNNFVATPEPSAPTVFNVSMFDKNEETEPDVQSSKVEENQQPKQEEVSFDIESEFNDAVKQRKSYADEIKTQTSQPTPPVFIENDVEDKEETTSIIDDNFSLTLNSILENNETNQTESTTKNDDCIILKNDEKIEMQTSVSNQTESKDEGIFITETPSEDSMPKVKKIEPASFSHLDIKSKLDEHKSREPIKVETENVSSISELKYFEDYTQLGEYYKKNNLNLCVYEKQQAVEEKLNKSEIYINKFNLFKNLFLFLLVLVESTLFYTILNFKGLLQPSIIYLYIASIAVFAVPLIISLINYKSFKNKKINIKNVKMISLPYKILLLILISAITFSINLLLGLNLENIKQFISTLFYPAVLAFNMIFVHIFKVVYIVKSWF